MRIFHAFAALFYFLSALVTAYAAQEAAILHPEMWLAQLLVGVCLSCAMMGYIFATMALHGRRRKWQRV